MPDWKKYVRDHLEPLRLGPEREAEIIDEMAQHLEAAYDEALTTGASEPEAEKRAAAHIKDWRLLECELVRAQRPRGLPRTRPAGSHWRDDVGELFIGSLLQDTRFAEYV